MAHLSCALNLGVRGLPCSQPAHKDAGVLPQLVRRLGRELARKQRTPPVAHGVEAPQQLSYNTVVAVLQNISAVTPCKRQQAGVRPVCRGGTGLLVQSCSALSAGHLHCTASHLQGHEVQALLPLGRRLKVLQLMLLHSLQTAHRTLHPGLMSLMSGGWSREPGKLIPESSCSRPQAANGARLPPALCT